MGKLQKLKRLTALCFSLVIALSLIFTFASPTAYAIEVDAGSTPGSGSGQYIESGLAIDSTTVNENCVGYRISVVQADGSTKGNFACLSISRGSC